jgi:hypothetical protein
LVPAAAGCAVRPEGGQQAFLRIVQGFIEQNLGDPGLDPVVVLFGSEHLAVVGWVRAWRLDRCGLG